MTDTQPDRPYRTDDRRNSFRRPRPSVAEARRQIRTEQRRKREAWGRLLGWWTVWAGETVLIAWAAMLLVGIVHVVWFPRMGTMSFGEAVAMAFLVRAIGLWAGNRGVRR